MEQNKDRRVYLNGVELLRRPDGVLTLALPNKKDALTKEEFEMILDRSAMAADLLALVTTKGLQDFQVPMFCQTLALALGDLYRMCTVLETVLQHKGEDLESGQDNTRPT